jgi:hypothetical protein
MHYQNLIASVMALPDRPGIATQSATLIKKAAVALGRKPAPELAGVNMTAARPNDEQPMSGEVIHGRIFDDGKPEFHQLDPTIQLSGLVPRAGMATRRAPQRGSAGAADFSHPIPAISSLIPVAGAGYRNPPQR